MTNIKIWPHAALLGLLVAIAAGAGVWMYQRYENSTAEAAALPNAARIQRVDGQVALTDANNVDWRTAGLNEPFSVGDRIYTRDGARTSLAFNGRNYARLDPNTSLDAIALTDERTQLAMRDGSALFDVGYLPSGGLFEVGTPYGAVDFDQPGLYSVDLSHGNAAISVLSGLAQVVGLAGSGQISKGEMLTLLGSTAADVALSRLNGRNAGYLVDDYYRYQYPNAYDGRYANYDTYLADPSYFDPYQRDVSYRYVTSTIPGVNDLSPYGDWRDLNGYGYAWSPHVATNWAPYQQGYWVRDYPYGMTWVSSEPWGYAPYHYGRWASVDNRWYWIPDSVNTTPRYSPALVGFVPVNQNEIGWVPLAPGDPYVARYYDENWQPHYLTRGDVNGVHLVNMAVPNAVTVVPVDSFGRPVDLAYVRRVDPATLAQVRPTLEPLLLTPLRNAAINSAWGRGKIDLPPGIAKKLSETPVVVGTAPVAPPFRKDLAKALRLEQVSDNVRNQKLKIRDERAAGVAPSDAARQQQVDALNKEAARGNQDARRQMQELEKQQREAERAQQQQQREAARGQQQQQREAARAQQQQQREAERVRQQQQREGERVQREQRAQAQRVSNPNRMRRIEAAPAARPVPPPRAEAPRVVNPARPARAEGVRAGNPPKAAAAPRQQPQPQPGRGAEKHENKQPGPPAKAPGGGGGGGGGKGKGKKP